MLPPRDHVVQMFPPRRPGAAAPARPRRVAGVRPAPAGSIRRTARPSATAAGATPGDCAAKAPSSSTAVTAMSRSPSAAAASPQDRTEVIARSERLTGQRSSHTGRSGAAGVSFSDRRAWSISVRRASHRVRQPASSGVASLGAARDASRLVSWALSWCEAAASARCRASCGPWLSELRTLASASAPNTRVKWSSARPSRRVAAYRRSSASAPATRKGTPIASNTRKRRETLIL